MLDNVRILILYVSVEVISDAKNFKLHKIIVGRRLAVTAVKAL